MLGAFTAVYAGALGLIFSFPVAPHCVGSRLKLRLRMLVLGKKVQYQKAGGYIFDWLSGMRRFFTICLVSLSGHSISYLE